VYWSADGNLQCKDTASKDVYVASVYGTPSMKGFCMNRVIMNRIEGELSRLGVGNLSDGDLRSLIERNVKDEPLKLAWS
jgi:hypothetical protein